jgi:serine/threonine protein kinase
MVEGRVVLTSLQFNVLIDESGRACLANYDLADLLATHYSVVQEPRWTDPELISGERSQLPTVSTDIYAFGCIMLQVSSWFSVTCVVLTSGPRYW